MTYGRVHFAEQAFARHGAAVRHLAELVRGDYLSHRSEGPLIRPSCRRRVFDTTSTFSPRGEGTAWPLKEHRLRVAVLPTQCDFHFGPHRLATG
jgi:hypothetical protein